MSVDRELRNELDTLSKQVFGVSSKWKKLVESGVTEMITEEKTEMVPGENGAEPTEQKLQVPVKAPNGAIQYRVKRFTVEGILEFMRERKKLIDQINEMNRKNREAAEAKQKQEQLAKQVHADLSGSAV